MRKTITVGMDMGDKTHRICVIDEQGEIIAREGVTNTAKAMRQAFEAYDPCLFAIEAGTHSGWVSRVLEDLGHEVLVGNARKLRMIWASDQKDDNRDAEMLARIARFDRKLLHPIHHRGPEAQSDLAVIKARDVLVKTRSLLVAHVRGVVKSFGKRISSCSPQSFHRRAEEEMPDALREALEPVLKSIEELTIRIRHSEKRIETLSQEKYPETEGLRAIRGVGPITALAFVLTLEEPDRFKKSRDVGPFLGMTPKRDQSGAIDKQLSISKAGNAHLRRLLVGCAQHMLGVFGADCDLRRFGLKLAERGGKNAKKRAVIAVARKLGVLMHHLWRTGESYDPFYQHNHKEAQKAA